MSQEDSNKFRPEVVFVAEGYEDAKKTLTKDVVDKRKFILNTLASQNTGGAIEFHEIIDLRSAITEFMDRLEAEGMFDVTDENGNVIGAPKQMPKELAEEIYNKTLLEINRVYEEFPPEAPIFELLDEIDAIDASICDGELIEIFIWPKQS